MEKPKEGAKTIPDRPDMVLASMGNYIFKSNVMIDVLQRNALRDAAHDFGKEIIPDMYPRMKVFAYDFAKNYIPGEEGHNRGYWRDVGTIDAYYDAHMDLVAVHPIFNLYNRHWPIYTYHPQLPPAKFVEGGIAQESMVGAGAIVAGATVRHSIIAPNVRLAAGAYVEGAVLMDGV